MYSACFVSCLKKDNETRDSGEVKPKDAEFGYQLSIIAAQVTPYFKNLGNLLMPVILAFFERKHHIIMPEP